MLISQPLPFVTAFIEAISTAIQDHKPGSPGLSRTQRGWLGICLMGIMVTNSVCWARFERASLGGYSLAALTWMFRHTKVPWELLLQLSVQMLLNRYGITAGVLVVDDSDKRRAKVTSQLAHVHKLKDKTSGGLVRGQCLVFLLLVTATITIPVGVAFYCPDPARTVWAKRDRVLKRQGVPKRLRPPQPPRQAAYPSKADWALQLLTQFRQSHPTVNVKCVLADALYGTAPFMDTAAALFSGIQVISQLRSNQKVRFRHRTLSVSQYFERYPGGTPTLADSGRQDPHRDRGQRASARLCAGEETLCDRPQIRRRNRLPLSRCFGFNLAYAGHAPGRYLKVADRNLPVMQPP